MRAISAESKFPITQTLEKDVTWYLRSASTCHAARENVTDDATVVPTAERCFSAGYIALRTWACILVLH